MTEPIPHKIIPAAIRGRVDGNYNYSQRLEPHGSDVTNTITTVQKDNVLIMQPESLLAKGGVSHCIEANYYKGTSIRASTGVPRRQLVPQDARIRRLTPLECWRLMGFSDADFNKAKAALNRNCYGGRNRSSSQLYRQAGNSIVVDVLLRIMQSLYDAMPELFEDLEVGSFFSGIGAFEKALSRLGGSIRSKDGAIIRQDAWSMQAGSRGNGGTEANINHLTLKGL